MSQSDYIVQPSKRTTLDAVGAIFEHGGVEQIDVAVAYITNGGAYDFVQRAISELGAAWNGVPKRWITSFDYCRTDPVALSYIKSIPNSNIRIYDADFCLRHNCAPQQPFHPKAFLVRTSDRDFALAGSGNMSRSGLSRGVEAGLVLSTNRAAPFEPTAATSLLAMRNWFGSAWTNAAPLTASRLVEYSRIYEGTDNLKYPVPTEDDVASTDLGRGALSTKDLHKLRVCNNFWIEAGNITKNRGPSLPGNQLMMKRLSRVFFGFPPDVVHENSHIGDIDVGFNGKEYRRFSLTYSDNKMDKLVLPIPGAGGPPGYDSQVLLFTRCKPGGFTLIVGTKAQKALWYKKSAAIEGSFKMSSGREWGVF